MPRVYEVFYAGGSSDFYAKRETAERMAKVGREDGAELLVHEYEPTQEGIAKLLNHVYARPEP